MPWKRFVDDTITCIKPTSILHVIKLLNSFHWKHLKNWNSFAPHGNVGIQDELLTEHMISVRMMNFCNYSSQ